MTLLLLDSNANPALEFTTNLFMVYIFIYFFLLQGLCFCRKTDLHCVAEPCKRTDCGHYCEFGRQFEGLLNSSSFMESATLPIY